MFNVPELYGTTHQVIQCVLHVSEKLSATLRHIMLVKSFWCFSRSGVEELEEIEFCRSYLQCNDILLLVYGMLF